MKLRKIVFVVGLMAIFAMLTPGSHVWAGAGPEPGDNAIIQGPELWGVIVVYCSTSPDEPDFAVVRVKRIVNCNVETQTVVDQAWVAGCPDPSDPEAAKTPLEWSLPGITFFDIQGEPFITKVKNFEIIDLGSGRAQTSFDAQFKFWLPGP